jgi:hypothetical protein
MTFFILHFKIRKNSLKFANFKVQNEECHYYEWKILNNSNYDNFHGGGDFSHAYVIIHTCFGKKLKMQKMST